MTFDDLLFEGNSYSISLSRAHSKVVLRVHGMDEAGVQFPVGPPNIVIRDSRDHLFFVQDSNASLMVSIFLYFQI